MDEYGDGKVGEVSDGDGVCVCYCYPGMNLRYDVGISGYPEP